MLVYYIDFDDMRIKSVYFETIGNLFQFENELDEMYEIWFYSNFEAKRYLREVREDDNALF